MIFVSTCDKKLPAESKLEEFRQSSALCVSNTSCCLYKIMENHTISYILIVWGKGRKLLLPSENWLYARFRVSLLPMPKKATRIPLCRIFSWVPILKWMLSTVPKSSTSATSVQRAVFLVETKQNKDENALATIRNIFSATNQRFHYSY